MSLDKKSTPVPVYSKFDYSQTSVPESKIADTDPNVRNDAAVSYLNTNQTAKDPKIAIQAFKSAALEGNPPALFNLGLCAEEGIGSPKDFKEAAKQYQLAADKGNPKAQCNLGLLYYLGKGVEKNISTALKWLNKAVAQNEPKAQAYLALFHYKGIDVEKDDKRALELFQSSAKQNFPQAHLNLAFFYENGWGTEKDQKEAARCYTAAATQGIAYARFKLGIYYENGFGLPEDKKQAAKWYQAAAEQGLAEAQYYLGHCYEYGEGVEENEKEAARWYTSAAQQNFAPAQFALGTYHEEGLGGIEVHKDEAIRLYKSAATQGFVEAQLKLGACYEEGNGISKDIKEAARWYRLAADKEKDKDKKDGSFTKCIAIYNSKKARADTNEFHKIAFEITEKLKNFPLQDFKATLLKVAQNYQVEYKARDSKAQSQTGYKRATNLIKQLNNSDEKTCYKSISEVLADKKFFAKTGNEKYFSLQTMVCRAMIDQFAPTYKGLEMSSSKELIAFLAKQLSSPSLAKDSTGSSSRFSFLSNLPPPAFRPPEPNDSIELHLITYNRR